MRGADWVFNLAMATGLGVEKTIFKPVVFHLKIDLVSNCS